MRIISGSHRGRKLVMPKDDSVRPTLARVREALFSMIAFSIPDAVVLDLFCGTGGFGLECLSRGASYVYFCDHAESSYRLCLQNIRLLKEESRSTLVQKKAAEYLQVLKEEGIIFDIIFLDPPYEKGKMNRLIQLVEELDLLTVGGLLIAEVDAQDDLQDGAASKLVKIKEKRYAHTKIALYERKPMYEGDLSR